jgi:hypothetical protein
MIFAFSNLTSSPFRFKTRSTYRISAKNHISNRTTCITGLKSLFKSLARRCINSGPYLRVISDATYELTIKLVFSELSPS